MADTKAAKKETASKTTAKKDEQPKPIWDKSTHGECPYPDDYEVVE